MEFLNFQEISKIPFKKVLDWLNVSYETTPKEFKCNGFVVNLEKNLYKSFNGEGNGSVINFLSAQKGVDLRSAAKELKDKFLTAPKEPKREIPVLELHYCKFLEEIGVDEELAKYLEIGFVKQRCMISSRLAFRLYDGESPIGYMAYNIEKKEWFLPKGTPKLLFNSKNVKGEDVMLTTSIFQAVEFAKKHYPVVSLMGNEMNDRQFELLKKFKRVLLFHPEPDNLILRLSKFVYVKCSA